MFLFRQKSETKKTVIYERMNKKTEFIFGKKIDKIKI